MGLFVRKVKTASGATAVQIAHTRRGKQTILEHIGSAHDDAQLAVLMQVAKDKIHAGQQAFDLDALTPTPVTASPTIKGTRMPGSRSSSPPAPRMPLTTLPSITRRSGTSSSTGRASRRPE